MSTKLITQDLLGKGKIQIAKIWNKRKNAGIDHTRDYKEILCTVYDKN